MKGAKVLIVDDDAFIRDLVKETLSFHDCVVEGATDGQGALAAISVKRPDVVLLDVRLGGALDGLEVCRRVCALEAPPPIIFLSGLADNADVDAGYTAGACGYLTKPFSPLELIECIRTAWETRP